MTVIRESMVELGQAEIRLVGWLISVCDSGFQCVVMVEWWMKIHMYEQRVISGQWQEERSYLVYHQNRFIRKSHLVGLLLEADVDYVFCGRWYGPVSYYKLFHLSQLFLNWLTVFEAITVAGSEFQSFMTLFVKKFSLWIHFVEFWPI